MLFLVFAFSTWPPTPPLPSRSSAPFVATGQGSSSESRASSRLLFPDPTGPAIPRSSPLLTWSVMALRVGPETQRVAVAPVAPPPPPLLALSKENLELPSRGSSAALLLVPRFLPPQSKSAPRNATATSSATSCSSSPSALTLRCAGGGGSGSARKVSSLFRLTASSVTFSTAETKKMPR